MRGGTDTIAAIATPPGRGAVGILRLSGPAALEIAQRLCGKLPPARQAALRHFTDSAGEVIDQGLVLSFPAPHSYTGEDVVELQGHGGPVVMDLLLKAACDCGARPARAGEFSERAFLNDRLDLAQAEAVADLIDAASAQAARAAQRSLAGELSRRVQALAEELTQLRVFVEAALDFSDEDIDWLADESLRGRLDALIAGLERLLRDSAQGRRLREGLVVALSGRPNAGKSTLLNRLAGVEAAIVTDIAGTTRDVLRENIVLDGLPLIVVDTAGLRDSDDPVEREGIRRAWQALQQAELALYLVDDREGLTEQDRELLARFPPGLTRLIVRNKCDLSGQPPDEFTDAEGRQLRLSAASGAGIDRLCEALRAHAGLEGADAGLFSARTRHLEALRRALDSARAARSRLASAQTPELVAEDLRLAQDALGDITGRLSSDDLLGRIFGAFCIGK